MRAALALGVGLGAAGLGGCDREEAVAYEGPYADKVADAVPRIEEAVGLPFKSPPKLEVRSRSQVRAFLERRFQEQRSQRELDGLERSYKRFGLLPDTLQLKPFLLDLLTEQIVGYYDPTTKVLYVVENAAEELVGLTITHELVHALQDQYVDLDSIQEIEGSNDRQTAAQAFIEGQATYQQLVAMLGRMNLGALQWTRVRETIRQESSNMPMFAVAPLIIQETLIFPYLSGAEFTRRLEDRGSGASPFERLPISTEQILHTDAYFGESADLPTIVELPEIRATVDYRNDLGEFETRLFLFQHLRDHAASMRGAAGWDGDRYALISTPSGEGLIWVTVWDSPIDAAEFLDLMTSLVVRRFDADSIASDDQAAKRFQSRDRAILLRAFEVDGRPLVQFVDVPRGVDPAGLMDVGAVRLEEASF